MFWHRHWPATVDFAYAADLQPASDDKTVWIDTTGLLTVSTAGREPEQHYRLRLGDILSVDILAPDRFVARAVAGTARSTLDHFLADQVIPRVVDSTGRMVLHAAAIRFGNSAILLIGPSGAGKSTLAASLGIAGETIMGDDASVIDWIDGVPHVSAVYPSLRLLPDSIAALRRDDSASFPVADYSDKRRLSLAPGGQDPVRLVAAFVLRAGRNADDVAVEPVGKADACMLFVENSFALDPTDSGRARTRLQQASALARDIPAFNLSYPRQYDRLNEVHEAITGQMAQAA